MTMHICLDLAGTDCMLCGLKRTLTKNEHIWIAYDLCQKFFFSDNIKICTENHPLLAVMEVVDS